MLRHASRLRFASAVLVFSVGAQPAQRTPPRDARPPPQRVGTGVIRGVVVAAGTGQPLPRALVSTYGPSGPLSAVTDLEGRFELAQLPAGSYTVQARKNLYLMGGHKQRRPNGPSQPVVVKDAQIVEGIVIHLIRYGAITGRVLDAYGEPAPNVQLHVFAQAATRSRRRPGRRSMMSTNDIGEYRVAHLEPGNYIVCAIPRVASGPMGGVGGIVAGRVVDGFPEPGTPTCYPSGDLSQAQPVTLPPGQESHDVNITLRAGSSGRIAGMVVNSEGQPATGASLSLLTRFGLDDESWVHMGGAGVRPDGNFSFEGVPPGEYLLEATVWRNAGDGKPGDQQRGFLTLTTAGNDLDGVVITVGQLAVITGRVVFELTGGKPPARVRVHTMPMTNGDRVQTNGVETDADYRFELRNLYGVQYLGAGDPSGLRLKSITHRGRDLLDVPLDLKAGDRISDVEVVLTSQTTSVEGVIAGAPAAAPGEHMVLLFPQNAERWRPRSRFVRMAGLDRTGRFRIRNPPPEQYFIVAWRAQDASGEISFDDMSEPEFLERLRPLATSVTVLEGDTRELSLSPITLPER